MSDFVLKLDEGIEPGIKRVLCTEIEQAVSCLDCSAEELDQAVHQTRKSIKRIRAGLLLIRPVIGKKIFRNEDSRFSEISKAFSGLRDAKMYKNVIDILGKKSLLPENSLSMLSAEVDKYYSRRRQSTIEINNDIGQAISKLNSGSKSIKELNFELCTRQAILDGYIQTYREGKSYLKTALANPTNENLHAFRKYIKHLYYQTQILYNVWPDYQDFSISILKKISDKLGIQHDFSVFATFIKSDNIKIDRTVSDTILKETARIKEDAVDFISKKASLFFREKGINLQERFEKYWKLSTRR